MLTRKNSIEGKVPFGEGAAIFEGISANEVNRLAMAAGDMALILDRAGNILDASANRAALPNFESWIGQDWLDTVTVESKPKIMEMLAAARKGGTLHWRQVNHPTPDGDIPMRYTVLPLGTDDRSIAVGRDMREAAAFQQRLLQAQQSLERDYMRMRQVETRYRLLFDHSSEPILIIDGDSYRIQEANAAAHAALGAKANSLPGSKILTQFPKGDRDALVAFLGSAVRSNSVSPLTLTPTGADQALTLSAHGFRQKGVQYLLVRIPGSAAHGDEMDSAISRIVETMPDAFALTDHEMRLITANLAFVEMAEAASPDQIKGRLLKEFVGRPGIDLDLIETQLNKHGFARNVSTIIGSRTEEEAEPVELSAVQIGEDDQQYGFILRPVGRRLRDLPPSSDDLPRSVEQLTELVGRMSLKEIVRESTDLIERLCIEAALTYTSDNRASAAEILGLSRQSLYSKLHRYGLGNLVNESD